MRTVRLLAVAGVVVVCAGAAVMAWVLPAPLPVLSDDIANRKPDVAHGEYVAVLGDCTACHTKPGGAPFAGGVPFTLPMGVIYSSNITPDRVHGMGAYSFPEFVRLMRQGVAHDGRRIYPAMPYTSYTKVSDTDLQDLYAYFREKVAPVPAPTRRADVAWPLSIRWPLAFWDRAFLDDTRFTPDSAKPAAWNRGAYIVEGFGHCGTCHTPRGIAVQEVATKDDGARYLSGAVLDGQSVSNLRANAWIGLEKWSESDIVELLRTARNGRNAIAGQMTEVVEHSTGYMTGDDLQAIATYLKTLSPAPAQSSSYTASAATFDNIMQGHARRGELIYMDSCSACHRLNGTGIDHAFPSLAGNATVLHGSPDSLISAIVAGARLPSMPDAVSPLAMPAYGWRYDDADIADLATFLRTAWGNHASAVTADEVREVRAVTTQRNRQRD